mmetsp:Transcript_68147/g.120287  ORF Transcript_68147/g.120287 Transcript_68147/m.120287 type:complete len:150 (+) Transcript_68147:85-534(+)
MARRSCFALLLLIDALLLCKWSVGFLQAPARTQPNMNMMAAASAVAITQIPFAAEAMEVAKWEYKTPDKRLGIDKVFVLLGFFLIHAAGVADFYAKKTGCGPAVPINPWRAEQFETFLDDKTFYNGALNEQFDKGKATSAPKFFNFGGK